MQLITQRAQVLERLQRAGTQGTPLLCPNAETPCEMEGILWGAQRHARKLGRTPITLGIGFTASYPDHPQLERLALPGDDRSGQLMQTARTWLNWLDAYADRPGLFDEVEVVPFLDHGWAPHPADRALMSCDWFLEAMGIVMFDASAFDLAENVARTAEFVNLAGHRVVVEGCAEKILEHAAIVKTGLRSSDLVSRPEVVERFVRSTGVDLVVPNLGTEHRSVSSEPLVYRRDIACDIAARVGPIQALHGTSSLGERIANVGRDGICKINYYTAMAGAATASLEHAWRGHSPPVRPIAQACGSFIHRWRREGAAGAIEALLLILSGR